MAARATSADSPSSPSAPPLPSGLTLKGRVACELKTTLDELVLTEAVCTGLLHPLSPAEATGFLSLFVSKGKPPQKPPSLPPALKTARDEVVALAGRLARVQLEAGVLEEEADDDVAGGDIRRRDALELQRALGALRAVAVAVAGGATKRTLHARSRAGGEQKIVQVRD